MKNYEEMSDHELLMELIADKRRREKLDIIKYAMLATILVAVIVGGIIVGSKIMNTLNSYNQMILDLQNSTQNLTDMFNNFESNSSNEISSYIENLKELLKTFGIRY